MKGDVLDEAVKEICDNALAGVDEEEKKDTEEHMKKMSMLLKKKCSHSKSPWDKDFVEFGIPPESFALMLGQTVKNFCEDRIPDLNGKVTIHDTKSIYELFEFEKIKQIDVSHDHHSHEDEVD